MPWCVDVSMSVSLLSALSILLWMLLYLGEIFSIHIVQRYVSCLPHPHTAVVHVVVELKVRDIEIATQVPKKFRFPLFSRFDDNPLFS